MAAFNIVSNLTMVVADKTREIGILKAMGMRSSSIKRIFFAAGTGDRAVGTALGVVLGLVVSTLIGAKKLIPLDPSDLLHRPPAGRQRSRRMSLLIDRWPASLIAALATLYPAQQAARLYPAGGDSP